MNPAGFFPETAAPATLALAFTAGLLSFLSPCVLPLIPTYLTFLAGGVPEAILHPTQATRLRLLAHAVLFICGFSIVFITFGLSASALGELLRQHGPLLRRLGGLVVVLFGLHRLGVLRALLLASEVRVSYGPGRSSPLSSFLLGSSFGFGWTPCIGPVLTSILVLAAQTETLVQGGVLLAAYSAGLALPFLVFAAALSRTSALLRHLRPQLPRIQRAAGVFLVLLGVLLFVDGFALANAYIAWPF